MVASLLDKDSFIGLGGCTWLYTGAESPTHKGNIEAINEYLKVRSEGPGGREHNAVVEQSCKENIASLIHGRPENIAFLSNSSEVISMVAQSLEFQPGDNIVINDLEFPSGVLPWLSLKTKGLEVRIVNHTDWEIKVDDILEKVDVRTRLVIASHVSFLSGTRLDYRRLYRELQKTETLLLLDVTQALGAVPVDINDTDLLVCSSYKWLLSTHGVGIFAMNPTRVGGLRSKYIGWRSVSDTFTGDRFQEYQLFLDARRFDLGYPSYPTLYTMNFSTKLLLDIGVDRIEAHILTLGEHLIQELKGMGLRMMTPDDGQRRAGNICFACSEERRVAEELRKSGIFVFGSDGRVRASIHLFNDSTDIDRLTQALARNSSLLV